VTEAYVTAALSRQSPRTRRAARGDDALARRRAPRRETARRGSARQGGEGRQAAVLEPTGGLRPCLPHAATELLSRRSSWLRPLGSLFPFCSRFPAGWRRGASPRSETRRVWSPNGDASSAGSRPAAHAPGHDHTGLGRQEFSGGLNLRSFALPRSGCARHLPPHAEPCELAPFRPERQILAKTVGARPGASRFGALVDSPAAWRRAL